MMGCGSSEHQGEYSKPAPRTPSFKNLKQAEPEALRPKAGRARLEALAES